MHKIRTHTHTYTHRIWNKCDTNIIHCLNYALTLRVASMCLSFVNEVVEYIFHKYRKVGDTIIKLYVYEMHIYYTCIGGRDRGFFLGSFP